MKKPYTGDPGGDLSDAAVGTRWDWTLGQQQYEWLQQTLANSTATYKFVFAHHEAGGIDDYGRGGALGAKYCEWGGYDIDGQTWAFDMNRPGWAMPVHQLLVQNHVTVFFHAHDHVYAKETLDGIVYQEMPMAANAGYDTGFSTNPTDYAGTTLIPNSGHLRVTVSPISTSVAYVRSFLPADGTNGSVAATYVLCAAANLDGGQTTSCQAGADAGEGGAGGSMAPGTGGLGGRAGGASGAGMAGNSGRRGLGGRGGAGGNPGMGGIGMASRRGGVGGIGGASGTAGGGGISGSSRIVGDTGGAGAGVSAGASGTDGVSSIGPLSPTTLTPPVPLPPTPASTPTSSNGIGREVGGAAIQGPGRSGCGCDAGPSPTGGPGFLLLFATLTLLARQRRQLVGAGSRTRDRERRADRAAGRRARTPAAKRGRPMCTDRSAH